jgi:hypothetical protein
MLATTATSETPPLDVVFTRTRGLAGYDDRPEIGQDGSLRLSTKRYAAEQKPSGN